MDGQRRSHDLDEHPGRAGGSDAPEVQQGRAGGSDQFDELLVGGLLGVQLEPAGSRGGLADLLVAKAGERVRATWVWPQVPWTSGPVKKSMSTAFIREAPLLDEFFSNRGGRQRHT
jgi:hypothetical protein